MPGTVPLLLHCQTTQSLKPPGSEGAADELYSAIQSGCPEKLLLPCIALFQ